jgi:hypothetical protein
MDAHFLQTHLGSFILLVTSGIFTGASYFTSVWRWQPGCFSVSVLALALECMLGWIAGDRLTAIALTLFLIETPIFFFLGRQRHGRRG